jgi:hypothetical protein
MGDGTRIGAGAKNENASSRVKCPQMHHNLVPVTPKSPSNKINKIPSRKSPIRDFRHQLYGKTVLRRQARAYHPSGMAKKRQPIDELIDALV